VEAGLQPGVGFAVQVRALAELGGEAAGRVLERQLGRPLSPDPIEQSWYWIDLAVGLRRLRHPGALAALLARAPEAARLPLGHLFAAEIARFRGFGEYLCRPDTPAGRSAARLLHQALEGLRAGVPPQLVMEARLGEAVVALWEHRPAGVDAVVARVVFEALRQYRRSEHVEARLLADGMEKSAWREQFDSLSPYLDDFRVYLNRAGLRLASRLRSVPAEDQADVLRALDDLRADVAGAVMPLLDEPAYPHAALAFSVLAWSPDALVRSRLCSAATASLPRRGWFGGGTNSDPAVRTAVFRALRQHASPEAEGVFVWAAGGRDASLRLAGLNGLGWWEPVRRPRVLQVLQSARASTSLEERQAAEAAFARLGERRALNGFRQALTGEDPRQTQEAARRAGEAGLTWLWADLDRLADAEDADTAVAAREALERMREEMPFGRG
jgi:hypothetical protein